MSTQEPRAPRASMFIHNLTNLVIIAVILFTVAAAWKPLILPALLDMIGGAVPVVLPTPAPATVATPRTLPAQVQPVQRPAAPAPAVVPTVYTQATAEVMADEAYQAAVEEMQAAEVLPNASKPVARDPGKPNSDWCSGSHLDNPECQPGNSSKVER